MSDPGIALSPVTTYLYRVNPVDLDIAERSLSRHLSGAEIERVERIKHRPSRSTALLGRLLVRRVLGGLLNAPVLAVPICLTEKGKPVLEGVPLHFNVSHSQEWIMLGVGPSELGIDLEHVKYRETLEALAHNVMHENEWVAFKSQLEADKPEFFYRTWVLKEACLKCDGRGISGSLKKVETRVHPPEIVSSPNLSARYLQVPETFFAAVVTSASLAGSGQEFTIESVFHIGWPP